MNILKRWRGQGHAGNSGDGGGRELMNRKDGGSGQEMGLSRFRDEVDRLFDRFWEDYSRGTWDLTGREFADWPAVDFAEDDKAVTLRVDLPGLDPKDVDVQVSGNLLTISGSKQDEWSEHRGGVRRRERRSGSFSRTITLPDYVDRDKVEARHEKGILTIHVPKAPGKGPRRVKVMT